MILCKAATSWCFWGRQNHSNLLLYLTTIHVLENFGGRVIAQLSLLVAVLMLCV